MLYLVTGGDQNDIADAGVGCVRDLGFSRANELRGDLAFGLVDFALGGIEDALETNDMLLGFAEVVAEGLNKLRVGGLLDHRGEALFDDLLFAVERVLQHVEIQLT